jgi:uncharacterized protein
MTIRFEWRRQNALDHLRKHGVSFETASQVFFDPFALAEQDRIENGQCRWQTTGVVDGYTLLVVAHTVAEDDDGTEVIRIVSARRADPKERKRYENQNL